METKKRITIGILAHVDAGKTTLSEALLVASGALPKAGRVDHGDSFLDTDEQEKRRGITIFSGVARLDAGETELILVDTPGHVDFSAEMERTLQILDYAVVVVSGRELVQAHTVTIWKLLKHYGIPVFIFVNKMDLEGTDREKAMASLRTSLDDGCVCFGEEAEDPEELAMCDEQLMDKYLEGEMPSDEDIVRAIARRKVFPCWFGSALKQQGVKDLLRGLDRFTREPLADKEFGAKVFRITRDRKGSRLTHVKITGGSLSVKDSIRTSPEESEKIHEIRLYSGNRYETADSAQAGELVALAGLEHTSAGQGLGSLLGQNEQAMLQPVLVYAMVLEEDANVPQILIQMRQLEEEDPQLHVRWDEQQQEIQVRLMGEIQLEILQQTIEDRFGFRPEFDEGSIEYRETIEAPVRGAGHFEPLRHYAEVHLLLEPLPEGSGLAFGSSVSTDVLDTNWQRLIMTHLAEREHPGALAGAPITDMRITIEAGRAHLKHTEGGDFRQATYRAIRQALRKAREAGAARLLEPWYDFLLEIPAAQAGRAMSDIQRMGGEFGDPQTTSPESVLLRGRAPVSEMRGYDAQVASYTKGYGHLTCSFGGYLPCHNEEEVIRQTGYDPDADIDNPADSVFCSHGAGRTIPWDEADEMMHVSPGRERADDGAPDSGSGQVGAPMERAVRNGAPGGAGSGRDSAAEEKELERIFRATQSRNKKDKEKPGRAARVIETPPAQKQRTKPAEVLPEYLLVDGYNIIFAWDELRELSAISIDAAREALIDILSNYRGFHRCEVIAVFDAYRVKGGREHTEKQGNITVVFTKEAETADTYIERATYEMKKKYRVRVATSDRLEQMIILGNDAFRVSARDLQAEVTETNQRIREILEERTRLAQREDRRGIDLPLQKEE